MSPIPKESIAFIVILRIPRKKWIVTDRYSKIVTKTYARYNAASCFSFFLYSDAP